MRAHPAADIFPLLAEAELAELADDIKKHGLHQPVWLTDLDGETVILDGRNRYRACEIAGIEPKTRRYDGTDPIGFSISQNLQRRHLTEGQKAFIALDVLKLYEAEGRAKKAAAAKAEQERRAVEKASPGSQDVANWPHPEPEKKRDPLARDKAAKVTDTSGRSVARAKRLEESAPDLAAKAKAGKTTLHAAEKELKKRIAAEQREKAIEQAQALPAVADLRIGDFREALADLAGVDAIITDPPYPAEFIPLLSDLSRIAAKILKPGGMCAVMMGQNYLPEVYARLTEHLDYHWTLSYLTPGGQAVQVWPKKVNTFWKPIITLTNGPRDTDKWIGDVAKSQVNDNDKRFHHWGQSESGMADLIDRLSKPGELVCDPFLGAGTTGVTALALGRRFVGCDLDPAAVARADARMKGATA